jgi:hypothetical protein
MLANPVNGFSSFLVVQRVVHEQCRAQRGICSIRWLGQQPKTGFPSL